MPKLDTSMPKRLHVKAKPNDPDVRHSIADLKDALAELQAREKARDQNFRPKKDLTK